MTDSQILITTCEDFSARLAERRVFESMVSKEVFEQARAWLAARINSIGLAHTPLARGRELLAEAATNLAFYEILTLDDDPSISDTEMRNQYGVSGELKVRLIEIASRNIRLKNELVDLKGASYEEILTHVRTQHCRWRWFAEALMGANSLIANLPVERRSWFKPFLHAMCVWQEDRIRRDLSLPRILGPEPSIAARRAAAYHTFLRFVLDLSADPGAKWRAHFKKWLNRGELVPWAYPG